MLTYFILRERKKNILFQILWLIRVISIFFIAYNIIYTNLFSLIAVTHINQQTSVIKSKQIHANLTSYEQNIRVGLKLSNDTKITVST